MKVFGADFSGARNPSRGIYYAKGSLENGVLLIDELVHCDDRLDLLASIHFSKAPWGFDFPFSVSVGALKKIKAKNWEELLIAAVQHERKDFDRLITGSAIPSCEARCLKTSLCCRTVDAADAAVACVPLAYALDRYRLESGWVRKHSLIDSNEWASRYEDGLIVKVD